MHAYKSWCVDQAIVGNPSRTSDWKTIRPLVNALIISIDGCENNKYCPSLKTAPRPALFLNTFEHLIRLYVYADE